ncbi:hypothetical protein DCAR_0832014 [Daucus carota subsp. sativus]|uniref:RNase H type-1 domain-containing protein n=1 Tax=Daucus carota subsp. sativus TaxID=79200 RepID=A0AAF0XQP4_DAUCS|nr:PREDICTED: uncharacterized protein LOC108198396 [Daucus carota subsp. sativus]WOH12510.1 hypothetical protein DCAR_0832014 [Daucus carota subsp. sativus]
MEESLSHLFWNCTLANWTWNYISSWWSINSLSFKSRPFSIPYLLSLKPQRHVSKIWRMVVSASLWSIWLARNDFVFNKSKINEKELTRLIFIRISKWGSASKIMPFGSDPLWNINPVGAINVHHFRDMTNFWKFKQEVYSTVCMVDAAWLATSDGSIKGGIGGIIKNKCGQILYCFSAPSYGYTIHEAEIEAILHVLSVFRSNPCLMHNSVICSDSVVAINAISAGLEYSFPLLVPDFSINEIFQNSVCLNFVPSDLNDEADQLAKDGLNRDQFSAFWSAQVF